MAIDDNSLAPFLPTGNEKSGLALGRNGQEYVLSGKNEVLEELAAALQTPELERLREELESAEEALETLKAEYNGGNRSIGEAAGQGDADKLTALSLRLRELPTLILAGEFKAIEAELRLVEAQRPIYEAVQADYSRNRIGPLQEEMGRLALEIRRLEAQRGVPADRLSSLRMRRAALRQRRDAIVGEMRIEGTPYRLRNRQ